MKKILVVSSLSLGLLPSVSSAQTSAVTPASVSDNTMVPMAEGYWSGWYYLSTRVTSKYVGTQKYSCQLDTYQRDYYKANPTTGQFYKQYSEQEVRESCRPVY